MAQKGDVAEKLEIVPTDDGRITARHVDTGISSYGDTEEEAVTQLERILRDIPSVGCAELWEYMSKYREEFSR